MTISKRNGTAVKQLLLLAFVSQLLLIATASAEERKRYCRYCESHATDRGDQQSRQFAASDDDESSRRYAPNRDADVLHIKIDVTPDFGARTIKGTATLRFSPIARPLRELRLDAVRLNIHEVRSEQGIEDYTSTDEDLTIVFKDPILPGDEAEVEIEYDAEPTQGLYFRTAEMGYRKSDEQIWTQGEPHEARHWFPCFDYPNERSSTEVICHVPRDMTVLSNGVLVEESIDQDDGLKTVHWRQDKPHANYLICLVAGYFSKLEDQHRDIPLTFYSQPSLAKHAGNSFRDTANIMAFFEEEIGIPFPWDKYAQVTIVDFNWGGMENTSLTTLTNGTIFSKETENIESSRGLDAHEMAHQWFGDYVTCKDWSHLWLNEGFATYYEHLHAEHQFGRDELLYKMYRDARDRILPRKTDTRPIVYNEYSSPDEQFDYRAYPKGSWVLHMLRSQLGEDLYRKCIKTYLQRHALTSVVTEELNSVIEEVSGRSFDQFFDQWVYHARYPDLRVSYRWLPVEKLAKVTIEQTHEVNDDVLLFEFPTQIRFRLATEVVNHPVEISKRKHEFFVPLPSEPQIVRFDPELTVLASVSFRKPDDMLLRQLKDESDVVGRLLAAGALADRGTKAAVMALQEALGNDPFYGVRIQAANGLREIGKDEAYASLAKSVRQPDARVRRAVVEQIGKFYRTEARDRLCEIIDHEKNPAIVATAIRALGKYSGDEVEDRIREALDQESFGHRTAAAAISAIDAQSSIGFREDLMETLRDREDELTVRQISRGIDVLCRLPTPDDLKQESYDFVSDYLDHPRVGARVAAVRGLGGLGYSGSRRLLQALVDNPNRRLRDAASAAIKKLDDESPADVADLKRTINDLRQRQEKLEGQVDDLNEIVNSQGKRVNELAETEAVKAGSHERSVAANDAGSNANAGGDANGHDANGGDANGHDANGHDANGGDATEKASAVTTERHSGEKRDKHQAKKRRSRRRKRVNEDE